MAVAKTNDADCKVNDPNFHVQGWRKVRSQRVGWSMGKAGYSSPWILIPDRKRR